METSQELDAMLAGSGASSSAYILVVAEQQQQPAAAAAAPGPGESEGSGVLGVLAVEAGSGDIAYALCSSSSSSSSSSSDGVMPLEAVLLSLAPVDVVVCAPVSAATERLLASYIAGATRRCRLERLQPQQWRLEQQQRQQQQQQQHQQRGRGASRPGGAAAPADAGGSTAAAGSSGRYLDAALLDKLTAFFGSSSSSAASGAGAASLPAGSAAAAAAGAAAAAPAAADAQQDQRLRCVLSLPQPVLCALAGALAYLTPFGLTGVLRCTSSYRALRVGGALALGANALTQLEVLQSGARATYGVCQAAGARLCSWAWACCGSSAKTQQRHDACAHTRCSARRRPLSTVLPAGGADGRPTARGSLLHVLDRCATVGGRGMLRRWLAAPLADVALIEDRQQAVRVLLDSSQQAGQQQQHQQQQQQQQGAAAAAPAAPAGAGTAVLQKVTHWLAHSRQDLERALARVAAGTAAPAEAVGMWSTLAQVVCVCWCCCEPGQDCCAH
jgi:hypothetical protein